MKDVKDAARANLACLVRRFGQEFPGGHTVLIWLVKCAGKTAYELRCRIFAEKILFMVPGVAKGAARVEPEGVAILAQAILAQGLFASLILPIFRAVRPRTQFSPLSVFSFLVACFAAELPGSTTMGRKDRNSQKSQSLSNYAFLEVIAQLKLQNQEFMGLLATQ